MSHNGKGKKAKGGKAKQELAASDMPSVIVPQIAAPVVKTEFGKFDLDDPVLPAWVDEHALKSGGYPYDQMIKDKLYEDELQALQIELVKLKQHVVAAGSRLVLLFEGRDAAGKGGAIFAFKQYLPPRSVRDVALPKPTEVERSQWYFQRYVAHLPTAGETVLFDRSWYNRAGVEPVMGFCTAKECHVFLEQAPRFEGMLVEEKITLFKFWLDIGRITQLKRFHERRHNPLKIWKLSSMDYAGLKKWDDYGKARDAMFAATHTALAPWTAVRANDKRRARLDIIRHVLSALDYAGKDADVVRRPDPLILGGPEILGGE